jgi:hypothetical protein
MQKVYIVLKNADMTEGRGPMFPFTVFLSKAVAQVFISKQGGVFGGPPDNGGWDIKEMEAYGTLEEYNKGKQEALKQSALKKLTREEKEVLGLI